MLTSKFWTSSSLLKFSKRLLLLQICSPCCRRLLVTPKVVFNANSRWDLQALTSSTERLMKSVFYGTTKARSSPSRIINLLQEVLPQHQTSQVCCRGFCYSTSNQFNGPNNIHTFFLYHHNVGTSNYERVVNAHQSQ
jgi:hypothetical protein